MDENELVLKTSIIDFLEEVNGGVSILIAITIYEFTFQAIYWIHPDNLDLVECEKDFLKLFGVEETDKLPFYKELCSDIGTLIGNRENIFTEFNI